MRYLSTILLCACFHVVYGQETIAKKPSPLYRTPQVEIGASGGFILPGATETTLLYTKTFKAGTFAFRGNANFNRRNHNLYFTTALEVGFMPFSTFSKLQPTIPPTLHNEFRNDYLVTMLAITPGAQLQFPISNTTKFCAGFGAGGMLLLHAYQRKSQKNILLEANIGILMDDMTGVGVRVIHPYKGITEETSFYTNSYMITGIMLDFRHRLTKPLKQKTIAASRH